MYIVTSFGDIIQIIIYRIVKQPRSVTFAFKEKKQKIKGSTSSQKIKKCR